MTDFEQYFKETSLGYELIHISSEEVVFRKDKDGRYLEPTIKSHYETWVASTNRTGIILLPISVRCLLVDIDDPFLSNGDRVILEDIHCIINVWEQRK